MARVWASIVPIARGAMIPEVISAFILKMEVLPSVNKQDV
jgi:hypothetical protein